MAFCTAVATATAPYRAMIVPMVTVVVLPVRALLRICCPMTGIWLTAVRWIASRRTGSFCRTNPRIEVRSMNSGKIEKKA